MNVVTVTQRLNQYHWKNKTTDTIFAVIMLYISLQRHLYSVNNAPVMVFSVPICILHFTFLSLSLFSRSNISDTKSICGGRSTTRKNGIKVYYTESTILRILLALFKLLVPVKLNSSNRKYSTHISIYYWNWRKIYKLNTHSKLKYAPKNNFRHTIREKHKSLLFH